MTSETIAQPSANAAPQSTNALDPLEVGWQFVQEYYTILNKDPNRLHCFYNKQSTMLHGTEGETVKQCQGQQEIHKAIKDMNLQGSKVVISNVDSQASLSNGILVSVLGEMETGNAPSRKFSQCFFLAEQPNGYFVLNDIFRFLKEEYDEEPVVNGSAAVEEEPKVNGFKHVVETVEKPVAQPKSAPVVEKAAPVPVATAPVTKPPVAEPEVAKKAAPAPRSASPPKQAAAAPVAPVVEKKVEKPVAAPAPVAAAQPPAANVPKTWATLADAGKERWTGQVSEVKGQTLPATANVPGTKPEPKEKKERGGEKQAANRGVDSELSVFIRGFTKNTKIPHIKDEFGKLVGAVKWVELLTESTAFLEFADVELVKKALQIGKITVNGETISIEEKGPRPNRGGRKPAFNNNNAKNNGGNRPQSAGVKPAQKQQPVKQ